VKRYAFIYNPAARGNKAHAKFELLSSYVEQLPGSKIYYSESKEHITELVEQISENFDVVVACGGDGTVREVASKLIKQDKTLGVIPLGTGNDLCKTLKIPTDLRQAFKLLLKGNNIAMDVGRCNDFIFLNSLGFGFDGLTNLYAYKMDWLPSILRYLIAALRANRRLNPFTLKIKKGERMVEKKLIMATFANGRVEGGSFWIAPEASVQDGKLNLVTVRSISRWLVPLLLPLFLIKKGYLIPHVTSRKLREATLIFDSKICIHADGEIINSSSNKFDISLSPNKLEVICGL